MSIMETRFSRFIRNRRSRAVDSSLEPAVSQSLQGQVSPTPKRPSIFTYQSRTQNVSDTSRELDLGDSSLRSFSYDSCAVGRPPTFIGKAQPGNGPVKLQASRRLSTGELIATTEEGALRDIRDGEYIVGRKDRSSSRSERSNSNISKCRTSSTVPYASSPLASPRPETPTSSRTWSNVPSTPYVEYSNHLPLPSEDQRVADSTHHYHNHAKFGRTSSSFVDQSRASRDSRTDFRLSENRVSSSHDSVKSQRTSAPDSNATLLALKKAEFSRLTDLYGPEAAAINLARTHSGPLSPLSNNFSPLVLEPMHLPPLESKDQELNRASCQSTTSESCYEESSGTNSPQRASFVSSQAGSSSTTAQTNLTDEDLVTSREDIRSMVEQIRSTYLDAFDAHASPPPIKKARKKRKKPKLASSPILGTPEQNRLRGLPGRQTWHPQNPEQDIFRKPRINSQPVDVSGRLSPIPASPPREEHVETGIKRADSTTLGSLMADITRANIKSQSPRPVNEPVKRNFSRPSTPRVQKQKPKDSWLNLTPDEDEDVFIDSSHHDRPAPSYNKPTAAKTTSTIEVHTLSPKSRGSFEALYQDLFGKDADDLWRTSSISSPKSPTLQLTYSIENSYHSSRVSTPRKPSYIASIPESPEYTHLADPDCPNGRPI